MRGIDKLKRQSILESVSVPSYKRHRFPAEVIAHAVWLYYRFALSFRDIEEMLASRGVKVSYEAIRLWCGKFGPEYARRLRQHRRRVGGRWHVDEVFIRINGTIHYLWRAVDQNGQVVDILVQARRNRAAAERFFRHLLRRTDTAPHTVVTDRLRSYAAALPRVLPRARHRRGHWLNNRAENSHQPTRERERRMRRFKSSRQGQRFLSVHAAVHSHFRPRRHRLTAARYRAVRNQRFRLWNSVVRATALELPV
jgi:putative transposase